MADHHSAFLAETLAALTPNMAIRDEEPLEDVACWANAILALLADEGGPHS